MSSVDDTLQIQLKFDAQGLIPAIMCDATSGQVLMFAYMNQHAFDLTLSTGIVHFWSRSRQSIWKKGETSGEGFQIEEIRVDCDQDVLQLMVMALGEGIACHTGRRSCFYRRINGAQLNLVSP